MARAGGIPLPTITDDRALGASDIQRSLRFNDDDSAYLNRTPSSAGNRKKYTISAWVKRSSIGSVHPIFSRYTANSDAGFLGLYINSDDYIYFTGWSTVYFKSNRLYRDVTSWSHIVCVVDTTQSTSTDRVKLYFNGELQTLATYNAPSQNADLNINEASAEHMIGRYSSNYMDGYMTEVNFIDGQALDSSYFGFEDSQTGIWMPKRYEGTYGTNGFYFDFSDNSSTSTLGIDKSPNGNDYTLNNFSVSAGEGNDSVIDTPTNKFPTLNLLDKASTITLKNGNLQISAVTNQNYDGVRATFGIKTGKYYWEIKFPTTGYLSAIGIARADGRIKTGTEPDYRIVLGLGSWYNTYNSGGVATYVNTTPSSDYPSVATWSGASNYSNNDVYMIAVDFDTGKIWWGKNNSWFNNSGTANPATGTDPRITFTTGNEWFPYSQEGDSSTSPQAYNFGQQGFAYTPPSGFVALSSENLHPSVPSIINPKKHFNTLIYTGNGAASGHRITGLQFQPDFVWIKNRGQTYDHHLYDSVRGVGKYLESNDTTAEATGSHQESFDSNGFTVGAGNVSNRTNYTDNTYVGWCWKAGGSSSTYNVDGKGYTTQSASGIHAGTLALTGASVNTTAGFSIVTWTGDGNSAANVGTGLDSDKTLDWVIVKKTNTTGEWQVGHSGSGYGVNFAYHMELNSGAALSGSSPYYMGTQNQTNGDRLYLAGNGADNGDNYIAYIWQERPGYSKFGTYDGNLITDGPFIHLGFRPAWVMIARLSGDNWIIKDSTRNTFNDVYSNLTSNGNSAEFGSSGNNQTFDFVSNGFKIRGQDSGVSSNGNPFIYMAFAEQPGETPFETIANAR